MLANFNVVCSFIILVNQQYDMSNSIQMLFENVKKKIAIYASQNDRFSHSKNGHLLTKPGVILPMGMLKTHISNSRSYYIRSKRFLKAKFTYLNAIIVILRGYVL